MFRFLASVLCRFALGAAFFGLSGLLGYAAFSQCYRDEFDAGFATLLMDSGHLREAVRLLEARRRSAAWDSQSTVLLARAWAGLGETRRCAEVLASVPETATLKPDALFREGQACMELKDAVRAESAWNRCVQHPAVTPEIQIAAWRQLAALYGIEDRQAELRTVLWSLYSTVGQDKKPALLHQLAELSLVREEPAARAKKLEQLVAGNDQDLQAKVALGMAYLEDNDLDKGLDTLQACLRQAPSDVGAWRGWLRALYQQGDLERLAAELDRAPPEMSQLSGFWKLQSIVAQEKRDWARAADALAKAIELSPQEADLHSQYAVALARLDQQELAEAHGRTAKQLRAAQADLRVAYEDWLQLGRSGKTPTTLQQIARRIASAYRLMGLAQEAEAWEKSLDAPNP